LSSLIFSWILLPLNHEFDVTYEDYKRVVYVQLFLTALITFLLFASAKILTQSNLAATLTTLFYVLDLPSVTMGFYIYTDCAPVPRCGPNAYRRRARETTFQIGGSQLSSQALADAETGKPKNSPSAS